MANVIFRELRPADELFLWEMLYHALYAPPGSEPFPRSIIADPKISRYVEGWGRSGDYGLIAIDPVDFQPVGAVWIRLFTRGEAGYGYVDEQTPELSIAVIPTHRGSGIGSELLNRLLEKARDHRQAISLSVSMDNPAVRLYQRCGFETLESKDGSLTMLNRPESGGMTE